MDAIRWRKRDELGIGEMDEPHAEFIALINSIVASREADDVKYLLRRLVDHTRVHFEIEGRLMRECGCSSIREHEEEHARVLGDLARYAAMAERGMADMARAFVSDHLPAWYSSHGRTMDAALARCVKERRSRRAR